MSVIQEVLADQAQIDALPDVSQVNLEDDHPHHLATREPFHAVLADELEAAGKAK